jgi:myosin V
MNQNNLYSKVWITYNQKWTLGNVQSIQDEYINVQIEQSDKIVPIHKNEIHYANEEKDTILDNLVILPHLNEPSLLHSIKKRYSLDKIYTFTGKVLIAVNPYKQVDLYNFEYPRGSPHVYEVADIAYRDLLQHKASQSILISGESGSGKTESTKYIMKYLSNISSGNVDIENRLLRTNPILESFGNASTVRNHNSSRFGKFIRLYFTNDGKLSHSAISTYLLEKCRLISQTDNERNFHIFYTILSNIKTKREFRYVKQPYSVTESLPNLETLRKLLCNFISKTELDELLKILVGILEIGNLDYSQSQFSNLTAILKIDSNILKESLWKKKIDVNGEQIIIDKDESQFIYTRDSLAKQMYSVLFNWLVEKLNEKDKDDTNMESIGILDIFGFEIFDDNYFEQLCINYTNETLQQQFNYYILEQEQLLYKQEGISWEPISFQNNMECVYLIDSKQSIFSLLNQECMLSSGTDGGFTTKCNQMFTTHSKYKDYLIDKDKYFGICHYAGTVKYNTFDMRDKNTNKLSKEIQNVLMNSGITILQTYKQEEKTTMSFSFITTSFQKQLKDLLRTTSTTTLQYIRCIKPNHDSNPNSIDNELLSNQLKYSGILEIIRISRLGYPVRIKYSEFEKQYYMLLCNSSIDEVMNLLDCSKMYQMGKTTLFLKQDVKEKLEALKCKILDKSCIRIQATYRGMYKWRKYKLYINSVIRIQSWAAMIYVRGIYREYIRSNRSTKIQALVRCYLHYSNYKKKVQLITTIQSYIRRFFDRKKYIIHRIERKALYIQIWWRMVRCIRLVRKDIASIIVLQSLYRRKLAIHVKARLYREQNSVVKVRNENNNLKQKLDEMKYKLKQQLDESRQEINDVQLKLKQNQEKNTEALDIYKYKVAQTNDTKIMLSNELLVQKQLYEKQIEALQQNKCVIQ